MKSAGVTTILLLTDSAMTGGLLNQATANNYHPEWVIGSFQYNDLGFFLRRYDQDQLAHAFGISNLPPGIKEGAPTANPALDAVQWYWGEGRGTSSVLHGNLTRQVHARDRLRGPEAHAEDSPAGPLRRAGLRRLRVRLHVYTIRQGFGRTDGLPYDEYLPGNKDYTAAWWDPETVGPPLTNLGLPGGQGPSGT